MGLAEANLELGEKVLVVLRLHEVSAILIGGVALAVHGYERATRDLDLGVAIEPGMLQTLDSSLKRHGWCVETRMPDAQDPLGGVIDVSDKMSGAFVQIVNFDNSPASGFPAVIRDAIAEIEGRYDPSKLVAVPLKHLIALKLYAGGERSKSDIQEVLKQNPDADLEEIRSLCKRYRLKTGGLF